ncbi:MAG: M23 family metallopeptidase, partial [Anaerolineales bacterium]|nr:M23 family metallopeptidase [Anaerolineales bacterium]
MPPESEQFWLQNPVDLNFRVNDRFNAPRNYSNNPTKKQAHEGIDLHAVDASGRGVRVLAAQRGVIEKVGNFPPGYGRYVRIRHEWPDGSTYVTWYGHLERADARRGDFVAAGTPIGIAGNTGFSFGIHLHLTLQHIGHGLKNYVVDDVVDPEPFFRAGGGPAQVNECAYLADVTIPDGTT